MLITGASGYIGSHTAANLAHHHPEIALRKLSRAAKDDPTWFQGDFADPASLTAAMEGVDVLFLVSATESADRQQLHEHAVDAAVAAGVGHIVYLSFIGADPQATFTHARLHYATEEYIRRSGVTYTMLRDNFYTEATAAFISDDRIAGPAGDGAAAFVARDDVARAAAAVLAQPAKHRNAIYQLTGPAAVTFSEVAAIASKYRETPVTYHQETIDEAYASRSCYGAPAWEVDAWVSTYTAIAAGDYSEVTGDVARLTGHEPLSVAQWWQQHHPQQQ
ncbi:Quinone oxidoreductase 2 [Corynebacterium choanae]|uniref:Quinone oxidoreductase 2 n=1 Tax=Corynebacterium choanae TaxID=1862358 RepID=A0A3G6J9C0_9CORY|nr:Quinone oxidoreductase 2 [Corynebacterium choanae]